MLNTGWFTPVADVWAVSQRLFGVDVDVLLHASTHRPDEATFGKGSALNPGSAVLPATGAEPTFLVLNVSESGVYGQIVRLA